MIKYLLCRATLWAILVSVASVFSSHFGIAQSSVLNSGNWFEFTTDTDGVYRLDYNDLVSFGVLTGPVPSSNIQMYSNGPGMLPEQNWIDRPFDLQQIAIAIHDQDDGSFDAGDYILFYGTDQVEWHYSESTERFEHTPHLYDNNNHYFLTLNDTGELRLLEADTLDGSITETISTFTDLIVHEVDIFSIHHSGKQWFGEAFSPDSELEFQFEVPNLIPNTEAQCIVDVVARCTGSGNTNTFGVSVNSQNSEFEVLNVSNNYLNDYVRQHSHVTDFTTSTSPINVSLSFLPHNQYSFAYLNYISLEVLREITVPENSNLLFRTGHYTDSTQVRLISVEAVTENHQVWETTNFFEPSLISGTLSNGVFQFKAIQDIPRTYIVFDPDNSPAPEFKNVVPNQNLKGASPAEGFIVTHPNFLTQAQQLADFHESHNNISVNVATTTQIYNEFSGGVKDITAIKDYMRYFYESAQSEAERPKYLCLFGDASVDYKGNVYPGTDFVPTFQTEKSFAQITSYCSDDYFALLDPLESNLLTDNIDVATGRLPAKTVAEAQTLVNKIIAYHQPESNGEWQQHVIFVADDEDNNIHMSQSNQLAFQMETENCDIHTERIFFDAFEQINNGNGDRYPGATERILNHLENGVIVCNYTGHSGISNWASEIVMIDTLFAGLQNAPHFPLFFMANCEFSRYDHPVNISGSEILMMNPNGGSIACVSNSRPGYSSSNYTFNHHFNSNLFGFLENGERLRLGDLIKHAKNSSITGNGMAHRSNNLLGDPMTRLNYPDLDISISNVQGAQFEAGQWQFGFDQTIDLTGSITTAEGSLANWFNGTLRYLILDSPIPTLTLGNDGFQPFLFIAQTDTITQGTTNVENGSFSFSAQIEENGNGEPGQGKMLLYAIGEAQSATGCFSDFNIESSTVFLEEKNPLEFAVYPNPVQKELHIQTTEEFEVGEVTLQKVTGESLGLSSSLESGRAKLSIGNLAPGIYLLRVISGNQTATIRVVKQP